MVNSMFNFWRNCQTFFHNCCTTSHSHHQCWFQFQGFQLLHFLTNTPNECEWGGNFDIWKKKIKQLFRTQWPEGVVVCRRSSHTQFDVINYMGFILPLSPGNRLIRYPVGKPLSYGYLLMLPGFMLAQVCWDTSGSLWERVSQGQGNWHAESWPIT